MVAGDLVGANEDGVEAIKLQARQNEPPHHKAHKEVSTVSTGSPTHPCSIHCLGCTPLIVCDAHARMRLFSSIAIADGASHVFASHLCITLSAQAIACMCTETRSSLLSGVLTVHSAAACIASTCPSYTLLNVIAS